MAELRPGKARFIPALIVLALLAAAIITHLLLWVLGDWKEHEWGLTLALKIVWGCWLVALLALVLTRVTIFGWYFRRYFRPPPGGAPPRPLATLPRPAKAPWYKSGTLSFGITVTLVSLIAAPFIATVVLWILEDVIGEGSFWLAVRIIWISFYPLCIFIVLVRIAIFDMARKKAREAASSANEPGTQEKQSVP